MFDNGGSSGHKNIHSWGMEDSQFEKTYPCGMEFSLLWRLELSPLGTGSAALAKKLRQAKEPTPGMNGFIGFVWFPTIREGSDTRGYA